MTIPSDSLPNHYDHPVRIAVIGGTGLSSLPGFTPVASLTPTTPWGAPSSPILILTHNSTPIAFLARHGVHHQLAPHEVPARANIAALRAIGVRSVIAFSAVGSLREEIRPTDFVVPDQIIDRTKGIRPFTFFEGGLVGHVGFADPFDARLGEVVLRCAAGMADGGEDITMHKGGVVVCMEGPQFSTRAESNMYRAWGGSVINMSALPEAKLAREAELAYQMICMATDYDCWHTTEDVDVAMVMKYMAENGANAKRLVGAVLDELCKEEHGELVAAKHWEGSAQGAVKFMTKPEGRDPEAMKRIEYLFPGFWEN
ncbi:nucleoside phosphorylase domain-containing protein [Podospora conica]|nr:nucleoside phosphorylase domain-containing protein [Schizothecium conicum]